jgi:type VI protein secretion system component Hcp
MRTIIFIILLAPFFGFSQTVSVYIKLTDARNQQINGESVLKGHERWIQATTTNAGGKNNTQFSFTMPVSGASADLKRAMANSQLLSIAEVHALIPNGGGGAPSFSYTIKMEQLTVLSCTEAMGCNNIMNTTVTLQATRIGWTYYNQNQKGGAATVSKKFGWDAATQTEWANF